jgi:hypothetical protein
VAPDHEDAPAPDDDTVVRAPVMPVRPAPAGPDLDDTVLSHRGIDALRVAPRPVAPQPVAPLPVAEDTDPRPAAAATAPATPAPPPPAPAELARVEPAHVRLPDGSVADVSGGTVYVGRRPSLPRVPATGVPQLVTVPSPGREVSSTHLSISAVGGAVVVRDMLSTNGTVLKAPGIPARTLLRGESAVVTAGTTLDLGDGNVIEVLR